MDRAYDFKRGISNPAVRVNSQLMDFNSRNFKFNSLVLPSLVEAVLLCAKQQIALQAHQQDRINFTGPATRNEGNFFAIERLLAKHNATLNEHLISGPKNAKYTSKTTQNKILEIAANQIRDFYQLPATLFTFFSYCW